MSTERPRKSRSGSTIAYADRISRPVYITLAPHVREHLDAMQAERGIPRSALVSELVEDAWERHELSARIEAAGERVAADHPEVLRELARGPDEDSPSFRAAELDEFEARGFARRNRGGSNGS